VSERKAYATTVLLRLEYREAPLPSVLQSRSRQWPPQDEEDAFIQNYLQLADTALRSGPSAPTNQD
jgi:hypothetical protein